MTSSDHTLLNISHEDLKHTHIYKFFQGEDIKKNSDFLILGRLG